MSIWSNKVLKDGAVLKSITEARILFQAFKLSLKKIAFDATVTIEMFVYTLCLKTVTNLIVNNVYTNLNRF